MPLSLDTANLPRESLRLPISLVPSRRLRNGNLKIDLVHEPWVLMKPIDMSPNPSIIDKKPKIVSYEEMSLLSRGHFFTAACSITRLLKFSEGFLRPAIKPRPRSGRDISFNAS